jgi:hypothetical protein
VPASCDAARPWVRHLGGIRIWAGFVSESGTDPAQIATRQGGTRFFGDFLPLSGTRERQNAGTTSQCSMPSSVSTASYWARARA